MDSRSQNNNGNGKSGRVVASGDRPKVTQESLGEFISSILKGLVSNPSQVEVTVMEDVPGAFSVNIRVAPEDKGRVIGKRGSTINALRTLVRVFGRVLIIVND